jgi:hypothetical protein
MASESPAWERVGAGGGLSGHMSTNLWPGRSSSCCCSGPLPSPSPGGTSADQWLSWNRPWESPRAAMTLDNHPRIPLECTKEYWALKSWVLCYFIHFNFLAELLVENLELKLSQGISQACQAVPFQLIRGDLCSGSAAQYGKEAEPPRLAKTDPSSGKQVLKPSL